MKASLPASPAPAIAAAGASDDPRRPARVAGTSGGPGFDHQLDTARRQGAQGGVPAPAPSPATGATNTPASADTHATATDDAGEAGAGDDKTDAHDGEPALVTAVFALFGQSQPAPVAAAKAASAGMSGGTSPATARPMALVLPVPVPVPGDVAATAAGAAVAAAAAGDADQAGDTPVANVRGMAAVFVATTAQAAAAAIHATAAVRPDDRRDPGGDAAVGALAPGAPMATTAPAHALGVAAPAGSVPFAQELGQQVVWLSGQDVKQANIRLHPQDLGSLEVKVSLGHDGRVDVSFAAQHPAAVTAVQQTLGQLDLMLAGQGLSLGQAHVGQQGSGQRGDTPRSRNGGGETELALDALAPASAHASAVGLLDTFA